MTFPFNLAAITGVADVTISGNTTYSTEAERIQIADVFTISGAFTLTAKEGLWIVCRKFVINNASGVLTGVGGAGGNAVGTTAGAAGVSGGISGNGGIGGAGRSSDGVGNPGVLGVVLSETVNVPDMTGKTQPVELRMLGDNFYSVSSAVVPISSFPGHDRWGCGGRGGGGGGGGGATSVNTGGAGGVGGDANGVDISWFNTTVGAAGAAGAIGGAGGVGGLAPITTFSAGFEQLLANYLSAWYFGSGSGGGGGGGGGRITASNSGSGGGGGAGGNPIMIWCDEFDSIGSIITSGGAGGNGSAGTGSTNGDGGGGGGGGAGNLIIVARTVTNQGTLTAAAGAAGSGNTSGTGPNGGNGSVGTVPSFSADYLLVRAA